MEKLNCTFILGAADPEMNAMEKMLTQAGQYCVYATAEGTRCHPGNAYKADSFESPVEGETGVINAGNGSEVAFIECGGPIERFFADMGVPAHRIDHHRPGDPGFGLPPAQFWEGSSIGQLYTLLGLEATPEALLVAAKVKAPGMGLTDIYGAPQRGYAGGYLP